MGVAEVRISHDLLTEVLSFPEGAKIIGNAFIASDGSMALLITHPDLPEPETPFDFAQASPKFGLYYPRWLQELGRLLKWLKRPYQLHHFVTFLGWNVSQKSGKWRRTINVDYVRYITGERDKINALKDLEDVTFVEGGEVIEVDPGTARHFELTGLSTTDFITTGYYQQKREANE